jgi:hypothetical protein
MSGEDTRQVGCTKKLTGTLINIITTIFGEQNINPIKLTSPARKGGDLIFLVPKELVVGRNFRKCTKRSEGTSGALVF